MMHILHHFHMSLVRRIRLFLIQSLDLRLAIQHLRDLFQGQSLGLGKEEIDDCKVTEKHAAPDDVVLPGNGIQSNRVDEAAEQVGAGVTKLLDDGRLGPQIVRADLHKVRFLRGGC